jgi:hypothetical protein
MISVEQEVHVNGNPAEAGPAKKRRPRPRYIPEVCRDFKITIKEMKQDFLSNAVSQIWITMAEPDPFLFGGDTAIVGGRVVECGEEMIVAGKEMPEFEALLVSGPSKHAMIVVGMRDGDGRPQFFHVTATQKDNGELSLSVRDFGPLLKDYVGAISAQERKMVLDRRAALASPLLPKVIKCVQSIVTKHPTVTGFFQG